MFSSSASVSTFPDGLGKGGDDNVALEDVETFEEWCSFESDRI